MLLLWRIKHVIQKSADSDIYMYACTGIYEYAYTSYIYEKW